MSYSFGSSINIYYFVFRFDNEVDADSLKTNLGTMLQEANIEEPTYCVMKSPSKKDEEMSLCLQEKEKFYRFNSGRSSFSDMVSSVSTSSFSAKFSDIRQSISNLRQDTMEKKESFCFLWAGSVTVLVLVILVMAGGT